MFISPRRVPRGSIRLSASSPSSPKSRSGAAFTAASTLSMRRSHTSSIATTLTQNRSAGPSPQTISSHQSSASASTMLQQRLDSKTANFWFGTLGRRDPQMSRYARLLQRLLEGDVVILDGPTGTELERRGAPMDPAAWCGPATLSNDRLLVDIHRDYIEAGAEVITANTFASSRLMLGGAGMA